MTINQQKNSELSDRFQVVMEASFLDVCAAKEIAVAVSGGGDSMALCHALSEYLLNQGSAAHIYALSVDHGLRPEAAEEASFVGQQLESIANASHHILVWDHKEDVGSRIQEKARAARYELMYDFMHEQEVKYLFLGHHQDDQAETFLFRLAKGSGLDGLSCMPVRSKQQGNGIILCRPLLGEGKTEILKFLEEQKINYVEDPSNKNEHYARVRLRNSMGVLSEEGLSSKRLYSTAKRMGRAQGALAYVTDLEYKNALTRSDTGEIVFETQKLLKQPLEIVIRIILRAIEELSPDQNGYGPRLERVENLCEDLMKPSSFRKRTLKGIIFEKKDKYGEFVLSLERR